LVVEKTREEKKRKIGTLYLNSKIVLIFQIIKTYKLVKARTFQGLLILSNIFSATKQNCSKKKIDSISNEKKQ